tara:strand:- start:590 stop:811 length:222 start_codon:yes stop_codon:yes gene_type:complete
MDDRPIDEVYETIRDVEQDPIGALITIQQLVAEVARLREALMLITGVYDPKDYGGNSEVMFSIAGAALQIDKD